MSTQVATNIQFERDYVTGYNYLEMPIIVCRQCGVRWGATHQPDCQTGIREAEDLFRLEFKETQ